MTHQAFPLARRSLLKTAGAALVVGFTIDAGFSNAGSAADAAPLVQNAFVRIGADNTVVVLSKHLEMGQGTYTGLGMILAEELDADWAQVTVEGSPADAKIYANSLMGVQGTGGSSSISNSYDQLRKAGATARAMLVQAAAQAWKVPASEVAVSHGIISHTASQRSATFGEFVRPGVQADAAHRGQTERPEGLRSHRQSAPRVDVPAKTSGSATYASTSKCRACSWPLSPARPVLGRPPPPWIRPPASLCPA